MSKLFSFKYEDLEITMAKSTVKFNYGYGLFEATFFNSVEGMLYALDLIGIVDEDNFSDLEIEKLAVETNKVYDIPLVEGTRSLDVLLVSDFHITLIDDEIIRDFDLISEYCLKNNNKLYVPSLKLLDIVKSNHSINYFSYKGTYYKLNLIGEYQIYNALMVILASNVLINLGYKIPFSAINTGIFETNFPARLEKLNDSPAVFLDGSHNIAGAKALKEFLHEYKGKKNYAIMSFTQGKDYESFINEISSYFQEILFVEYNNTYKDSVDNKKLISMSKKLNINATSFSSLKDAYDYLIKKENTDLILITGSLYLASEYRNMLTEE